MCIKFGIFIFQLRRYAENKFSGGEPFIEGRQGKFVGEMVRYCKHELGLSVSIVSNGSLIKEQWFNDYGKYILLVNSLFSVAGCIKVQISQSTTFNCSKMFS